MRKKVLQRLNDNTQKLVEFSEASIDELTAKHPLTGNTEDQVEEYRDEYGINKINMTKRKGVLRRLVDAFVDPFSIVLIVLGIVYIIMEIVIPLIDNDPLTSADPTSTIIIFVMVLVAGGVQFVQEAKSGKAFEKLTEMVETTTQVERDSIKKEIPLDEVVMYDIIHLRAGDIIPADLRLVYSKDLFVTQSSLTGESEPIEKFSKLQEPKYRTVTDRDNILFMGTTVESGYGIGLVIATGEETFFGQIASKLSQKRDKTSFEKGIKSISKLLICITLIVVPLVLLINLFLKPGVTNLAAGNGFFDNFFGPTPDAQKNYVIDAVFFAVSIAVGLTPEMLPAIVAASLAKGATAMSKKKVIIKKLNAIQNFGGMDILCTDKTGTLTEDRIIVEQHLDIEGKDCTRVLRHAYLNSYFQTGLKNLLDLSIIEKTDELEPMHPELQFLDRKYKKVDEIPFDFARRRMSVVLEDTSGKTQMITKGAIEEIVGICDYVDYKGKTISLDDEMKRIIFKLADKCNADGYRVIGVAQKTNPTKPGVFSVEDEAEMVLLGLLTFLDPPKESCKEAIEGIREYGVTVKILTGDNEKTTAAICRKVGVSINKILLGNEIALMSEAELIEAAKETDVFAKVSPQDKARVVRALKAGGHVVGFMGDGINDAPALRAADVSISVDTAADIAKESADIILLEKDLNVLKNGIIEGRKTFGNMMKYINLTVSSNFGNIFSILVAAIFLPFLPMLPLQLLLLNLIYDLICISLPWDNVSKAYLMKPQKIDIKSVIKFMIMFGPVSSIFDITTYLLMFFVVAPQISGGQWDSATVDPVKFQAVFRAGWFVESLWTQLVVLLLLRTRDLKVDKLPSTPLLVSNIIGAVVVTAIPFIPMSLDTGLQFLAPVSKESQWYILVLFATLAIYAVALLGMKRVYYWSEDRRQLKPLKV